MTTPTKLHELSEDLRETPRHLWDQYLLKYCKGLVGESSPSARAIAEEAAGAAHGERPDDDSAT